MSRVIQKGATDRSVIMRAIDSTDGTPETGFAYNTSGIDLWYRREGGAVVSITEATLSAVDSAHSDGGVIHIRDGYFRLDAPDAAFATGANSVMFGGTATGMIICGTEIQLVNYNPEDGVRLGLTALPNAAADAAGGLPISDAGALDLDTQLATLTNGTYGLSAIENLVDDLESRLTATRAGYLDNLSAGAVALASVCTEARLSELASANIPADIDTLISRLTALRAGYLDKLNITGDVAGATPLATMQGNVTDILADTAEIQAELADGGRTDLILDAILSDTNELQTDWHDGGRLDLLLDTAQNVGTIKVWNGTGWE
jgi:hypothetical protein